MLTTKVTKRLDIPHEDGEFIEIRKLSWRTLQRAQDVLKADSYAHVKTLGKEGMEAVKDVSAEQIEAFRRNVSAKYDRHVLLATGIVSWSYDEPVSEMSVDELDSTTADLVVHELLKLAGVIPDEDAAKNV